VSWAGKRVLVTGAGGFIGSHLCEALVGAGASVTALVRYSSRSDWGNLEHLPAEKRDALRVVSGNVEDAHFVLRAVERQEVVFHLAALITIPHSYVAPSSYPRTNVEGTLNVLEAARFHGTPRVVHTSTSETYGTAQYTPIDEKHPLTAQSPYAASKIGADKIAESYFRAFGVPVATLRPFNTYGPRQSARGIVPAIVSQALVCNEVRVGNLGPVRDVTFVGDTVRAFLAIATCDAAIGEAVNVGSGTGVAIGDLARKVLAMLGKDLPLVLDAERARPESSEVHELVCDARKAASLLGWSPTMGLEEGLSQTIGCWFASGDTTGPQSRGACARGGSRSPSPWPRRASRSAPFDGSSSSAAPATGSVFDARSSPFSRPGRRLSSRPRAPETCCAPSPFAISCRSPRASGASCARR
jgi:NAD dependent epimerase/dehydratase